MCFIPDKEFKVTDLKKPILIFGMDRKNRIKANKAIVLSMDTEDIARTGSIDLSEPQSTFMKAQLQRGIVITDQIETYVELIGISNEDSKLKAIIYDSSHEPQGYILLEHDGI